MSLPHLSLLSVQPVAVRGALSMDTEGGDLGGRGHGVGMFPAPFMGRRHSHFEDRSSVRNVSYYCYSSMSTSQHAFYMMSTCRWHVDLVA